MSYEIYPAVDENFKFPQEVREAIADYAELEAKFATVSAVLLKADLVAGKIPVDQIPVSELGLSVPPGGTIIWPGRTIPETWSECDGTTLVRTDHPEAFSNLNPDLGIVTITIASPSVFTLNNHGFQVGDSLYLTTSGVLPTGFTANVLLFVTTVPTANRFTLGLTPGGSPINGSGTQTGTHHVFASPWGNGDGSTTFNKPDLSGFVPVGRDTVQPEFAILGTNYGEKTHALTVAENAAHDHVIPAHLHPQTNHSHDFLTSIAGSHSHSLTRSNWSGLTPTLTTTVYDRIDGSRNNVVGGDASAVGAAGDHQHSGTTYGVREGVQNTGLNADMISGDSGSGTAHNNIQPSKVVTYIMKL